MHHTTRAARAVVAAALAGGLLAGAAPAWADGGTPETAPGTVATPAADPAADIAAEAAAEARARVERLAKSALPAEIRTSAWNALRSTRGDAAVTDWLARAAATTPPSSASATRARATGRSASGSYGPTR